MERFEKQSFSDILDRPRLFSRHGNCVQDMVLDTCYFDNCCLSIVARPEKRTLVRNVRLTSCTQSYCTIYPAVIEDTVVDNLECNETFLVYSPAFKHVVLRGRIGNVSIIPHFRLDADLESKEQRRFSRAIADYYSDVDWALNIQEALFNEVQIGGIPTELIQRDEDTQMILTRDRALEGKWKSIDLAGTHWQLAIERLLQHGEPARVLIAPKLATNFDRLLESLLEMRDRGIVE
jgi:hypothetical protein